MRCPLAKAFIQCTISPGELVICGLAPPPDGASLPRAHARVLALLQRDSLRSLPPHRPHVSLSEVLPSAFASCGIPPDTPSGWHLLPFNRRARIRLCRSQLPCFASVGRCFPPGFCGSAYRSVGSAAGALSCAFWLQRLSLLRWVMVTMAPYTFACAAHRCLRDGIPSVRLPGSAIYPRFSPLRTSRRPGGYAVTPAPGGRGLHPHGN